MSKGIDEEIFNVMETQIVYKLGTIEAQVKNLKESLNNSFEKLSQKIEESNQAQNVQTARLEIRVEKSEEEIKSLREWKNAIKTRLMAYVSLIGVFWVVFGRAMEQAVVGLFK